jgi:serine/threonine protein kinase
MTKKELFKNIKNKNISYINNISPLANNLLQQLLKKDLSLRITASLALKHPWITRNESDPIPLNLYEEVNKIIIKNKMINLLLISLFMKYISNKWDKYKIISNYKHFKSNKNNNIFKNKNFKQKIICSLDLNIKIPSYYKSTSSQQLSKFKMLRNLKQSSYNMHEINKNANMENISDNFKNKIKLKPNIGIYDSLIFRNKNNILPKIPFNPRTIDKKLSSNNHTVEKCNNTLRYRFEECKKKLFRNNSNWDKRSQNNGNNLINYHINKRYLK